MEAINISKLNVLVKGVKILEADEFYLPPGKVCYLAGHSGSGKSIFFKSLIRLLPINVQKFSIFNENALAFTPEVLRSKIMYLNQQPQIAHHYVYEFIDFISKLSIYQKQKIFIYEHIKKLLSFFDKNDSFYKLETSNLSGGETQILQLVLGITLCQNVLLLDEAFSAMDRRTQEIAEKIVLNWLNDKIDSRSIIFSSHQPELTHLNPKISYGIHKGKLHFLP